MPVVTQLILASQSPFRRTLLASTGLAFETQAAPIDEYAVQDKSPAILAHKRSMAKALAVAKQRPGALIIGADQVLGCDGKMFDKAHTAEEAAARLRYLAGKTHVLYSGLVLAFTPQATTSAVVLASHVEEAAMPMRALSENEIQAYVATGEWQGSVGCYQFENRGNSLFEGVASDQSSIVGLPLQRLLMLMRGLGINSLLQPTPPWNMAI